MVLRPCLEALGRGVGRGIETWHVDALEQCALPKKNAHVRTIELVRRTGEEIAVERLHVDQLVWREVHGVDVDERSGGVRQLGGAAHVGDGA